MNLNRFEIISCNECGWWHPMGGVAWAYQSKCPICDKYYTTTYKGTPLEIFNKLKEILDD